MTRYKFYLLLNFVAEECWVFTAIAVGLQVAGLFMQKEAADAQAKQAEYDSEHEAEIAENQAQQEKLNRAEKEKSERSQSARRRAAQRASYAKSGVLLEGTPLTMLSEQAGVDELNIQQGNLESRQRQSNLKYGAQSALQSGKNRSSAMRSAAKTSLLTGLGKAGASGASGAANSKNWWD
jgi:hypothetical protein